MSVPWVLVPAWPAKHAPPGMVFEPVTWEEMMISIVEMTVVEAVLGWTLLRSSLLPAALRKRPADSSRYSRPSADLILLALHSSVVLVLCLVSYHSSTREWRDWWAVQAFSLEIGYEIFDTIHTNKRVSPYAIIHHICSILAITMSAFAMSDYNLVLHLAVCMEFSGLWLAACKLVSRHSIAGLFGKSSKGGVDSRWMLAVYLPCRVLFPLYDVSLIIVHLCCLESPSGSWSLPPQWARPYVCCYAALFAFYCYFCWVLVKKSLPGHFLPRACELRTIVSAEY